MISFLLSITESSTIYTSYLLINSNKTWSNPASSANGQAPTKNDNSEISNSNQCKLPS